MRDLDVAAATPTKPSEKNQASEIAGALSYQAVNLSDLIIERLDGAKAKSADDKMRGAGDFKVSDKQGRFSDLNVSPRFLTSLGRKTGISKDFFRTFSPEEVLERVVKKDGDRQLVIAADNVQALGVTLPEDTLVRADQAMQVIEAFDPRDVSYSNGIIQASFDLKRGGGETDILGENYAKKFMLSVPIDGVGGPELSPILIRLICTNGLVGEGPMFSSDIKIGRNDAGFTLERALATYSGDKPFARVSERLELSRQALASVSEVRLFTDLLTKHMVDQKITGTVWRHASTLSLSQALNLGNEHPRYLRKIASKLCRYDLINMVTEARTHVVKDVAAVRVLDAFVSTLIARDPDLEGSINKAQDKPAVALFFAKAA